MRHIRKFAGVLIAFALVAAACGGDDAGGDTTTTQATTTTEATTTTTEATTTTTEATTTTQASRSDGVLKIGYLLPATGTLAAIIDALAKPIEMGVAEAADAGIEVTLVPGDSGTDPNVASVTVDQLLNDEVDAIIGAAASGVSLSVIDKITGSQVVQCSPSNTAAVFTTYEDEGYYFRTAPSDTLQGPALADVITDDGATSVAIVYRNDEYGAGFTGFLADGLEANGVTVAAEVAYDTNATSFDAEVGQVVAAGVDAVVIITFGEGATLLQAMIEANAGPDDIQIYVADGFKDTVSAADVDKDDPSVLEGIRGTAPSAAPPNGEPTFLQRFQAFAPDTPTIFSAHSYDCLVTIVLASLVAGTDDPSVFVNEIVNVTKDGEKCNSFATCKALIDAGTDIDYDGASGPLDYIDAGEPSGGVYDVYQYDATGAPVTESQVVIDNGG